MTADLPRPVEVTAASSQAGLASFRQPVQTWDLGDTEPRDVETRVEWAYLEDPLLPDATVVGPFADRATADWWASSYNGTLVSRTVHVGPWVAVDGDEVI